MLHPEVVTCNLGRQITDTGKASARLVVGTLWVPRRQVGVDSAGLRAPEQNFKGPARKLLVHNDVSIKSSAGSHRAGWPFFFDR